MDPKHQEGIKMAVTTDKAKKLKAIVYVPDDPDNKNISKAEFVEKRRKAREKAAKLAAYADKIDAGEPVREEDVEKAPEEPKKTGRPSKKEKA
jgi:hypothetical protein